MKKVVTLFLIFTLSILTVLPTTVYSQTKINITNSESRKNDLKTIIEKENLKRFNSLLGNSTENVSSIKTNSNFLKNNPLPRRGGAGKKVWIPVLIGLGVGIYFLVKYVKPGSSGIRCNDGTISQAQNRQGACSSHGGIAPGN